MTMRDTVASWLRDGLFRRIDFYVGRLHLVRTLFHEVATEVADGRMPLALQDGSGGEYLSDSDTMWLPRDSQGDRQRLRGLIAHEAVHGWCDKNRGRMDFYDEEAASYLVQVWLLRLRDQGDRLDFGSAQVNRIMQAASAIIDTHRLHQRTGVHLTRAHIDALREAIRDVPQYRRLANQYPNTEHHNGLIRQPPCCR